ncbi:MAG: DMT family transporter [Treponema sp.]|jgi:drug/metabolite transporter (DMT)-like permease|nr:DMT family transporter [Treponema sp.]
MNKKALRADILLLLTALIWGSGFVAQRSGMEYVGPFTYNAVRFCLGSLSLFPIMFYRAKKNLTEHADGSWKTLFLSSLAAGTCLFLGVTLQQIGLMFTTAGNAAFITGFYAVLTPIFGGFWGRKTGAWTWVGALFTLAGLYFMSAADNIHSINVGDIFAFISAFFWTAHVLLIDRLVLRNDPIRLSAGQFAVCGLFCFPFVFLIEPHISVFVANIAPTLLEKGTFAWLPITDIVAGLVSASTIDIINLLIPILYGGLAAVGIAYTLQVIAQRDAPPAHATIILCFEGCFGALSGILILAEPIGRWTLLGFALMLIGMLLSQWEVIIKSRRKEVV